MLPVAGVVMAVLVPVLALRLILAATLTVSGFRLLVA